MQDIAYKEFRNTDNKTPKNFIDALKRQGVSVEPVRNKQDNIYGIRFRFKEQTFKASEIGKEFGLRSLFHHYGQYIDAKPIQAKHFEKEQISETANNGGLISGLVSIIAPSPDSEYNQDKARFQKQFQVRKKKKRRGLSV